MLTLNEEQEELRRGARRFLSAQATTSHARAAMATDRGWDEALWRRMSGELGWAALPIPEAYGGAGGSWIEMALVLEEAGRALACSPLFASCLATSAILAAGTEAQHREYLPRLASGELTATVAIPEQSAAWDARDVRTMARATDDGFVLSGEKRFVVDGHTASLLIVAARTVSSAATVTAKANGSPRDEDGIALFAVPASATGMERRALPTIDATRRLAAITLRDVHLPRSARLGDGAAGWPAIKRARARGAIALAAEQVGGAERCLEMSVGYAKVRTQFGRPIGSFQAIKHACADMLVDVESARSAVRHAAWVAATTDDETEIAIAASLAKAFASEAFFRCASETIQVHGGIGFTWEHDAHLFFKRARASEQLLGDPAWHRDFLAGHLGLMDVRGESHAQM